MHRAGYLHGVIAKITTWKDLFKKIFLKVVGTTRRTYKNFLSIYLASWRNILSSLYSQSLRQRNKTLMTRTKSKEQTRNLIFLSCCRWRFPGSVNNVNVKQNWQCLFAFEAEPFSFYCSRILSKIKRESLSMILIGKTKREIIFFTIANVFAPVVLVS